MKKASIIFIQMFCLLLIPLTIKGATITVTNTNDSGAGSLRQAVLDTNAMAGGDTISFSIPSNDSSCDVRGVCTIILTSGELRVAPSPNGILSDNALLITNNTGANRLLISGNNQSRVFYIEVFQNLTLDGVTVINGNAIGANFPHFNGRGGGILAHRGGISIKNSAITNNTAITAGGGVYQTLEGSGYVLNSTISNNTANFGGGYYIDVGWATMTNSTVSGNTALISGGGIANSSTTNFFNLALFLNNTTVTNNRALGAVCTVCTGGIRINNAAQVRFFNTIVAGNTSADSSSGPDFGGDVTSSSINNIIGSNQGSSGFTNGVNNNKVGSQMNLLDAGLFPLANNGGPTLTHALQLGSPAINAGDNNAFLEATDQRGFPRLVNSTVDIGAYELLQTSAATVSLSGRVLNNNRGAAKAVVSLTNQNGETRSTLTNLFGYYRFEDVQIGESYTVTIYSKRYQFSPQIISVFGEMTDLNFVAQP